MYLLNLWIQAGRILTEETAEDVTAEETVDVAMAAGTVEDATTAEEILRREINQRRQFAGYRQQNRGQSGDAACFVLWKMKTGSAGCDFHIQEGIIYEGNLL